MKYNLASLKHLYQKDPPDFKSSGSSSALSLGWAERGSVSSWLRGAWAQKKAWWTYWKYKWQRSIVWWGGCNKIFRGLSKERGPSPYFTYEKCQAWVASWVHWVGKTLRTSSTNSLLNMVCFSSAVTWTHSSGLNNFDMFLILYSRKQGRIYRNPLKSRGEWVPLSLVTRPAVNCCIWRVKLQWQPPVSRALKAG